MSNKSLLGRISDGLMTKKKTSALILAAGSGERFSEGSGELAGMKKQFVPIGGVPVLLRTVRVFERSPFIHEIIVVTGKDDVDFVRDLLGDEITKLTKIVPGGATRQESAMAGLEAVDPKSEYIAIHDGARCLITEEIIADVIKTAYDCGAAAAAQRAVDTVKFADDNRIITETIDRDHVWLMKTPQVFQANMYRAAVYTAFKDGAAVTDDCMLVERIGFKVRVVDCGNENIKLTYPIDKVFAEAILNERKAKEETK